MGNERVVTPKTFLPSKIEGFFDLPKCAIGLFRSNLLVSPFWERDGRLQVVNQQKKTRGIFWFRSKFEGGFCALKSAVSVSFFLLTTLFIPWYCSRMAVHKHKLNDVIRNSVFLSGQTVSLPRYIVPKWNNTFFWVNRIVFGDIPDDTVAVQEDQVDFRHETKKYENIKKYEN